MNYYEFIVGEKEYRLRLGASQIKMAENKIGRNLLDMLIRIDAGELPKVGDTLIILHASLQKFHHNMTMTKVEELYDNFIDSGKTYTDIIPILMELFRVSGLIGKAEDIPEEAEAEELGK